ncbi:MAG: CHAT domain-containing protein [Cyclobacteriaceae bacterium]|nr:CHAT domain-containing protein [Cyclobacteriaceae bacterium]
MKPVLLYLLMLCSTAAWAQVTKLDVIPKHPNVTDAQGLRQGWWTIEFNGDQMRAASPDEIYFYRIIEFKDDKPVGVTRDYFTSGVLYQEFTLLSLKPYGKREFKVDIDYTQPYKVYWEDGSENLIAPNRIQAEMHIKNQRFDLALPFTQKALAETEKRLGKKNWCYAYFLKNMGAIYQSLGNLTKAEPYYIEHMQVTEGLSDSKGVQYVTCVAPLAYLYYLMGDLPAARALYQKQRDRAEAIYGKNSGYYSNALNNLALIFQESGNYRMAREYYTQSLAIREAELSGELLNEDLAYATTLQNLGSILIDENRFGQAREMLRRAAMITERAVGKESAPYASRLGFLGSAYELMGKYKQADSLYLLSLAITGRVRGISHPDYTLRIFNLAYLHGKMENLDKAESYYLQGIEGLNRQIAAFFPALSDYQKTSYYQQMSYNFENFNTFCMMRAKKNPDILGQLYNNQLANKAMLLNAASKWKHRIRNSGDKKLFALYTDWEANQNTLARWYKEGSSATAKIDSLKSLIQLQEKQLSKRSEMFTTLSEKKPVSWLDVKARLKPGEAAIEMIRVAKYGSGVAIDSSEAVPKRYMRYGRTDTIQYAALIVTANSAHPELVLLPNGNELEGKQSKFYFNAIKNQLEDRQSYALYWKPIADKLAAMKVKSKGRLKIYFAADGIYNLINLNTLFNPASKKYLFEEVTVGLVTNTKDLVAEKKEETANNLAYLVGYPDFGISADERSKLVTKDRNWEQSFYTLRLERGDNLVDLPGTKTEVENIASLMTAKGWQPEVLLGGSAMEESLKDCYKPRVLHIATHGYFQPDASATQNPLLRSGLLLAGSGQTLAGIKNDQLEDGILTAYEAMNLNLDNTDLVVLSACETGLGQVANGEGVYGLQRAFKIAGAQTIIMSLWKVNDESTQELMSSFYQYWLEGRSKREAFDHAQLTLKAKYNSPYYWGAFVMVGE